MHDRWKLDWTEGSWTDRPERNYTRQRGKADALVECVKVNDYSVLSTTSKKLVRIQCSQVSVC